MTATPWAQWHEIAFGALGYDPRAFYRLSLKEWLSALRRFQYGGDSEKAAGLLAVLAAMFDNYFAARGGKAHNPPRTAYDYAPWMRRPPELSLEQRIKAGLRSIMTRG